jgi:cell wall-associated NlpC family hydrolase
LPALIGAWLDAPYLWGGRTVLGVDCSGFAQNIYKVMDIHIARDAHEQALQGHAVGFLQEAVPGDLAFFDDEEGKIIHVGILLSESEIVHAAGGTGKVQIDKIDNEGIVRSDNGQRTHKLRVIRRHFKQDATTDWTTVRHS